MGDLDTDTSMPFSSSFLCFPLVTTAIHTATLPLYYQPYSFGHIPPVDTPLTLGPIGALCVLALVCLLWNINAESKKKA